MENASNERLGAENESDDLALSPGNAMGEHLEALSAWSGARVQAFVAAQQALLEAQSGSQDKG